MSEDKASGHRERQPDPVLSARGMRARFARSMGPRSNAPGANPVLDSLFNAVRANHPKADLARRIARKLEDDLQYPGQIEITVIREFRAKDYAR